MGGDVVCQFGTMDKDAKFSWSRFAIFTGIGGFYVAPVLHVWYGTLGRLIPGISTKAVVSRVAADQLVFAPLFVPSFFAVLLTLSGTPSAIPDKIRQDWWSTVKVNWGLWVPAQIINFRFVPANL